MGFTPAPKAANDAERVAALHQLNLLDTPPEQRFDQITDAATRLLQVPIAVVTLVDADRQFFKACIGLEVRETPRSISICSYTILNDGIFEIPNMADDPLFADHPLVVGPPYAKFYAGRPIWTIEGQKIGTLCIMDRKPRHLSEKERQIFQELALWAQLEIRYGHYVEAPKG